MWCRSLFCVLLMALALPAQALEVETARISGVTVWYAESTHVPVVDVVLSFEGAGSISDPTGKAGRAVFAAGMLNEGAGTLSGQEFQRLLDAHAIGMSFSADMDRLQVRVRCLREHAAKAGELLALALTQPTLSEPDMARVKMQMQSIEAQRAENAAYQAGKLLAKRAFAGHPYSNLAFGTPESVQSLTAQDVRDYLGTYITRGNVKISAAGDIDRSVLETVLESTLEGLPASDAGAMAIIPTTLQGGGEAVRAELDVPQTVILFAAPAPTRADAKFYTAYVLNHILGGNDLIARLGNEVRQKKGLVYSISTALDVRRGVSLLSGALATSNGSADAAIAEVKTVLATLREKGITGEECNDAKSYIIGHLPLQLDRSENVSSLLHMMQLYNLGEDYLETRAKSFKQVRCSEVNAMARELLAPEKFLFAIVGGKKEDGTAVPAPASTPPAPHGDVR